MSGIPLHSVNELFFHSCLDNRTSSQFLPSRKEVNHNYVGKNPISTKPIELLFHYKLMHKTSRNSIFRRNGRRRLSNHYH